VACNFADLKVADPLKLALDVAFISTVHYAGIMGYTEKISEHKEVLSYGNVRYRALS